MHLERLEKNEYPGCTISHGNSCSLTTASGKQIFRLGWEEAISQASLRTWHAQSTVDGWPDSVY